MYMDIQHHVDCIHYYIVLFRYLFLCDNWLSAHEGDGKQERVLKASLPAIASSRCLGCLRLIILYCSLLFFVRHRPLMLRMMILTPMHYYQTISTENYSKIIFGFRLVIGK